LTKAAPGLRDRQTPMRERQRVLRSRDRFWRPEDLKGPASTKQHLFASLVEEGELRRVRRGLYWRGTKSPLGIGLPPTQELINELAPGPGVGPAGLYAANLLRLSTQVPRQAEIAVPYRAPAGVKSVRFTSRPSRSARAKAGLSPTEVALLEVLGSWERSIELPPAEAWVRLRNLLISGPARPERLARAAKTEPGSVRARLRELLRAAGRADLAGTVPAADERTTASATRLLRDVA
jgi:hypothetical protein